MMPETTTKGKMGAARAEAWARFREQSRHQSYLLFFWWGWQMNMAFIGVYALPALSWPNKFQVGGPGDYDWGRQYYKPTHKWERFGWFPWLTFGLCLSSFLITLCENVLSMFNKLSATQLKRSEWTKAIMWLVWFLCISTMALVKLQRGRAAGMDRYTASVVTINGQNHVQVWPNYESYPNGLNVLAACAWCFPFWFSLLIMRKHLRKGTSEQCPAQSGSGHHESCRSEDSNESRDAAALSHERHGTRGGYDGTHDSVEVVQPSQGSLEERHPAYASAFEGQKSSSTTWWRTRSSKQSRKDQ